MRTAAFHDVDPEHAASMGVLARALDGEVFVLRRLLQRIGIHDRLIATCRAGIERADCDTAAWSRAGAGFDELHRFVPVGAMPRVTTAVQEALKEVYHDLLARLLRDGLGFDHALYAMKHPIPRFLVPHDATLGHRDDFQRYSDAHGHGKITTLRPHRDSWFADSPRTINIWIAAGPVEIGNGLSIYPEHYGRTLDFVPNQGVTRGQAVGVPVNFELEPGDVVVFHADHLHASELNRTDRTRHVVSFRVQTSRSSMALRSTDRLRSFHPSRPFFTRVVDPAARKLARLLRAVPARERPARPPPAAPTAPTSGSVRIVSDELCAVELPDGGRRVFARRCPHQGADLALGYLKDESIVCPWHNLPFDLRTGRSPCATVPALSLLP